MEAEGTRRSDRIYLEFPIQLSGVDSYGGSFTEQTQTLVVSRHGAKILSRHAFVPQQALTVRCHKTGVEAMARVVGQIGADVEGNYYGLEISDPETDLWGIDFPSLSESDPAAGRVLLECVRCHAQEIALLDVFALEVLLANQCLLRPCKRCADKGTSLWKRPSREGDIQSPVDTAAAKLTRSTNERRDTRVGLKVDVCVRHPQLGDEIAVTENISRGGFRFKSRKRYEKGTVVEAALPYMHGAANIFAPARIVYWEEVPEEGLFAHGVAYVPAEMATSLTGLRILRPW
jgi:hypothetical protein